MAGPPFGGLCRKWMGEKYPLQLTQRVHLRYPGQPSKGRTKL